MARIDYSDHAKLDERTSGIVAKNRSANIFRMMAHSPDYLRQYCRLGAAIRFRAGSGVARTRDHPHRNSVRGAV
jgi:hypothetical protein